MSLDTKILGLDQKVDFSDGSVSNVVRIELPNGTQVVALVTDEGAQHVLAAVQSARKVFKEQPVIPSSAQVVYAPRPAQPPVFEFGGGDAEAPPFEEEEDEAVVGPQFGPQLTRVRVPAADDRGNPVDAAGNLLAAKVPVQEDTALDEDGVRGL